MWERMNIFLGRKKRLYTLFAMFLFVAYAGLVIFLMLHHEPWRDEADAWLLARDNSLLGILGLMPYAGTPCLWYLLLAPFAKIGLPYAAEFYLHTAIAIIAVGIFLRFAPFPLPIKVLFIFSFYMSFIYAIIARSYCVGILLLFSVASLYPKRFHRPTSYGLLVMLLFNVNVHSAIIAGTLLLIYAWEIFSLKRASRETFVCLLIMLLGLAVTLAQLWPPPDSQFPGLFVMRHDPSIIKTMIYSAFASGIDRETGFWLGLAVIITSLVVWLRTPVSIFVFIVTFTLYSYIIIFKWTGGDRHYGLLLIALVFCHWIAVHYHTGQSILAVCKSMSATWFDGVRIVQFALLTVSLFFLCRMAIHEWKREIRYDFSGAREMAKYIVENNLDAYTIAAHKAPYSAAVLPYLRTKQFWYPAEERYGSNMLWNANYRKCLNVSYPVALDRIKKNFPDRSHVLVLLNQELSNPQYHGLKLLYSTRRHGLLNADERFSLYKFLPAVQNRP